MNALIDNFGRIHEYVRISLTNKCNLNCIYCNPDRVNENIKLKQEYLTAKEILKLSEILVSKLGIKKIRLTGGEPLLRKDLRQILEGLQSLKEKYSFQTGITTNGTGLAVNLPLLKKTEIDLLNISLDTLNPYKFRKITGKPLFENTLSAIEKSFEFGFEKIKINTVIMKGINSDELEEFIWHFAEKNVNIRFIEYMPFLDNGWNDKAFMSSNDMKEIIGRSFELIPVNQKEKIAEVYSITGVKCLVSFISPVSNHFCGSCNRLRITSDGKIKSCLFSEIESKSLKLLLNDENADENEICQIFNNAVSEKKYKHPDIKVLKDYSKNKMLIIGG